MLKRLLPFAVLLAASRAFAFDAGDGDLWKQYQTASAAARKDGAAVKAQAAKRAPAYKDQAAIDRVLVDMADGNEIGEQVAGCVRADKLAIKLDAKLPDAPRVLAPLIARQAAEVLLAGMPASSEREYMRVSLEVRSWLELGGDKAALPVIDGWTDAALAAEFRLWLDNGSESALEKIGAAAKAKSVVELGDEKADKRFVDFLLAENDWRQANAFRLK